MRKIVLASNNAKKIKELGVCLEEYIENKDQY